MKIDVLGTGCPKCIALEENVRKAVKEMGLKEVEINHITDIAQIVEYDVMTTPAFAVNGEVKIIGKVASVEDIKKCLSE